MPPAEVLKAIRTEIFDNGDEFREILDKPSFKSIFPELYDDQLKTTPKGYPSDHKHIDLLRYKSYAFGSVLTDNYVISDEFLQFTVNAYHELYVVNRYLAEAIHKWM